MIDEKNKKPVKKPLGQVNLEKFCSKNNNLILNYIHNIYKDVNYKVKLMTNKTPELKRNTHCGAHICVETPYGNDYFYITKSRKDYLCQDFLTINENLLPLLKNTEINIKILLFNNGNIYRFNKYSLENIKVNENHFVNIPLEYAEDIYKYSFEDFLRPVKSIKIDWNALGLVRYSRKFDMHKTKCRLEYDHISGDFYKKNIHIRKEFNTVKEMFEFLNKCEVMEKPVKMRAFYKYLKQGFVYTTYQGVKEKIYLISEKAEKAAQLLPCCCSETAAHCAPSILVAPLQSNQICFATNSDSAQFCATEKISRQNEKKVIDILAEKIESDNVKKYSEKDILAQIIPFGTNKNMLNAYVLGLYESGFVKEAEYASKMFNILNNTKIGD